MISKSYDLDVTPSKTGPVVRVSRYDTDFQILLYIKCSAGEIDLKNGTRIDLRGTKPNGSSYTKQCYFSGVNTVLLQGDSDLTDIAGIGTYELCFTYNNKMLHTDNFIIKVEPSALEGN